MEGILTQPHARNSTMPMERQQTIVFNQPTASTKTWDDATDDETSPWDAKPDDQLSPGEIAEVVELDSTFPIQSCLSPTISTMSEESGSIDIVGHPTIPQETQCFTKEYINLQTLLGANPNSENYLVVYPNLSTGNQQKHYTPLNVHNNPSITLLKLFLQTQ